SPQGGAQHAAAESRVALAPDGGRAMKVRLSGTLFGFFLVLLVASLASGWRQPEFDALLVVGLWLLSVALVGSFLAARRPSNAIGWLLVSMSIVIQAGLLAKDYAHRALVTESASLPLGETMAWLSTWLTLPGFALLIFVFMLFPSGHLPSSRWRWPARLVAVGVGIEAALLAFEPGPVDGLPGVTNPLGTAFAAHSGALRNVLEFFAAAVTAWVVCSLLIRARKGPSEERQQIKWVAYAALLLPLLFLLGQLLEGVVDTGPQDYLTFILVMLGLIGVPLSLGVAILRYRLYDIDHIINRTLVYGALTAVLAGTYALCVVVIPQALGVGGDSELIVAGSTLLVAALFGPARRRIQGFIDRRFYRSRYDSLQTAEAFGERLRNQVQLEEVSSDLLGVVRSTMHPVGASLWLRRGHRGERTGGS
ncbi:MAG TPA: hypothetical protein VE712_04410, partial [Actinomycetota bacterium]|nr:hypothetical protein [Actinomycetota bacterium]